jgi:hypothetical protein
MPQNEYIEGMFPNGFDSKANNFLQKRSDVMVGRRLDYHERKYVLSYKHLTNLDAKRKPERPIDQAKSPNPL